MKHKFMSILIVFLIFTYFIQPLILNSVSFATKQEVVQENEELVGSSSLGRINSTINEKTYKKAPTDILFALLKALDSEVYLRMDSEESITGADSDIMKIKSVLDLINKYNMNNNVYYTSDDRELLKLIKTYNENANFNYVVNNWTWDGSDSIVSFIKSLKNSNNKVLVEINEDIYKDTIAQTLKYNEIPMRVIDNSADEDLKLDKPVYRLIINNPENDDIQISEEHIKELNENFGNYTDVDPSQTMDYNILAKDNCGVMFQAIQNSINSNVLLNTNDNAKEKSLFNFKNISKDQYMIICKNNSLALSAKDNNDNSKIILAKQNQADKKQIWKIVHNSNGTVSFINAETGKAIQPEQETQKKEYKLIQSKYVKDKNAQSFFLYCEDIIIKTSGINIFLNNTNSKIGEINFDFSANKKITEKDVINKTNNQIYDEIRKKLTEAGFKEEQYIIKMWKDTSRSIADDIVHYYIKIIIDLPDNALESNPDNYTKVDPSEVVNYKILSKDNSYIMFQNTQNNVGSNIKLFINVPAKDESLYRFKKVSNTGYMIISKKNSLAISAKDNNNSKLILVKQNQNDKKQIWKIIHNSNGTVSFINAETGKAIQPEQNKQNINYSLIQSTYVKNQDVQSFYLFSDEIRIQTTSIRVYLPNSNSELDKINFSFSVDKKITEKNVIKNTEEQIYAEVKKKLKAIGLKDKQYNIYAWKNNSTSIADDQLHYYIKVELNIPKFPSTDYAVEALTHRGYKLAPELTCPAYWMARLNGFHYSGADIRVTKDGVPVLYHDANLVRTARTSDGGTISSDITIENLTYAEVTKYDYGIYKNSAWKGTQILTLDQYIKLCKQLGLVTNLHLKPDGNINEENLQKIVNIVNKYNMRENVYYASEEKSYLTIVKSLDKDANFDFLVLKEWNWDGEKSIVAFLETLKSSKNKVELGLSRVLYQDSIAKTLEFNGFKMTISGDSPEEILAEDKSIDVISTDKMEPADIQKYALKRQDRIGTYITSDPKEQINYKILAKDNCGVMFQTIKNTVNSNIRLYSNPDKDESMFKFKKVSNVGYMIISKKISFAISAQNSNNNSKLILAKQNQADKKQIWKIVHNSNGTVSFVNASTGKAIQPDQSTQKKGYVLIQSSYNKTKNAQQFFLQK